MIRKTLIHKEINESLCYIIDLENMQDEYLEFKNVSALMVKYLFNKMSDELIIEQIQKDFSDCSDVQIINDLKVIKNILYI